MAAGVVKAEQQRPGRQQVVEEVPSHAAAPVEGVALHTRTRAAAVVCLAACRPDWVLAGLEGAAPAVLIASRRGVWVAAT